MDFERSLALILRSADQLSNNQQDSWLSQLGLVLLNNTKLNVFGSECLLREIEIYHHSAKHPDPFAHQNEIQRLFGKWCFHRVGKGYRNGNYKGLDLTFGDSDRFGGILIRSIETSDGELISGPSLCVDYLIDRSGAKSVSELDTMVFNHDAWAKENDLHLTAASARSDTIFRSARVGLILNHRKSQPILEQYIARNYRLLTLPKQIKKGRVQLIVALLQQELSIEQIHQLTGTHRKTIESYAVELQKPSCSREMLYGRAPGPKELCAITSYFGGKA